MALLYQEIMKVPGLSGTWQQRNKDLYYKLGAPYGSYKGDLKQNMWLQNQIRSNNFYQDSQPWNTSSSSGDSGGAVSEMEQIANNNLENAQTPDPFSEVMPQDVWNSVFDTWTYNFANEYMLPEWVEQTYNPKMEALTQQLYDINQKMGSSGDWRMGTAQKGLDRASEEALKQEEAMRQGYQDKLADFRNQIQNQWATPLYKRQMEQYTNSPFNNINTDAVGDAGIDTSWLDDLMADYGMNVGTDVPMPTNVDEYVIPEYDWRAPEGDTSLLDQYLK